MIFLGSLCINDLVKFLDGNAVFGVFTHFEDISWTTDIKNDVEPWIHV